MKLLIPAIIIFSLNSFADEKFQLKPANIEATSPIEITYQDTCSATTLFKSEGLGWAEIINFGLEAWRIVRDNNPKLNWYHYQASALPRIQPYWDEMECWQPTMHRTYKVTYENFLGVETVEFKFKVLYTPGGSYLGRGRYLRNVTILPEKVDVAWAHELNAHVTVNDVVNIGTTDNPVAGMEIHVHWRIENPMTNLKQSMGYFVTGDGQLIELN